MQTEIINNLKVAVVSVFEEKAMRENLIDYAFDCNNTDFEELFSLKKCTVAIKAKLLELMPEVHFPSDHLTVIASKAFISVTYDNVDVITANAEVILDNKSSIDLEPISTSLFIANIVNEVVAHQAHSG